MINLTFTLVKFRNFFFFSSKFSLFWPEFSFVFFLLSFAECVKHIRFVRIGNINFSTLDNSFSHTIILMYKIYNMRVRSFSVYLFKVNDMYLLFLFFFCFLLLTEQQRMVMKSKKQSKCFCYGYVFYFFNFSL